MLSTIVQHAPAGICIIGAQGIFREVNARFCAIYGFTREELVGNSFTLVFAPEQHELMRALHSEFMNDIGELVGSWPAVGKDGRTIQITSESIRVPGDGDQHKRLVYV